jgi:hypothetical protein
MLHHAKTPRDALEMIERPLRYELVLLDAAASRTLPGQVLQSKLPRLLPGAKLLLTPRRLDRTERGPTGHRGPWCPDDRVAREHCLLPCPIALQIRGYSGGVSTWATRAVHPVATVKDVWNRGARLRGVSPLR